MDAIVWISEQRIREAMDRGLFENSPYRGRRISLQEDESIPPELRMAFKILRDAGCLPPEVELRKDIGTLSELLDTVVDPDERKRIGRDLNDKLLRLELLRRRR